MSLLTRPFLTLCHIIRALRWPDAPSFEWKSEPAPLVQVEPVAFCTCGYAIPAYALYCELCGHATRSSDIPTLKLPTVPLQPLERETSGALVMLSRRKHGDILQEYRRSLHPEAGPHTQLHRSIRKGE